MYNPVSDRNITGNIIGAIYFVINVISDDVKGFVLNKNEQERNLHNG